MINKLDSRCAVVRFCYHLYDYRPNWTPLSPITITYLNVTLHAHFSVAFKPLMKREYPRNVWFKFKILASKLELSFIFHRDIYLRNGKHFPCFYNSIETRRKCFLFLLENSPRKITKNEENLIVLFIIKT